MVIYGRREQEEFHSQVRDGWTKRRWETGLPHPRTIQTRREIILIKNQVPQILKGKAFTINSVTQIMQAERTLFSSANRR